jgi:phage tail-like protein
VSAPLPPDTVRYALLRADGRWGDVVLDGLEVLPDGTLELRRVPAVAPPHLDPQGPAARSGLALDRRCGLYVVDTAGRRLVRDALDCPERHILDGGTFQEPAGVCVGPFGWVFVADAAAGRVLVLSTPELSVRDTWSGGLSQPVGVAPDDGRGVYVLDAALQRVLRFDPFGTPDADFAALVVPPEAPASPQAIAAAADGALFVAGGPGEGVLRFSPSGASAGPALAPGTSPQALAVGGEILYAADAAMGEILVVSIPDGDVLGAVSGFRGPVTALAADAEGRVYVKPGADDSYLVAQPRAGRVGRGTLVTTAPLDAGEEAVWLRATADADAPAGTRVLLDVAADAPGKGPSWERAAAPDTLLERSRYVSLRVTLTGIDGASPALRQVRVETPGDSYFQYLPAVYSRDPEAAKPLGSLLAIAKAELGDLEGEIALLPRRFRAATASGADLERLAYLLALPVPETARGAGPIALRAVLDEVEQLYASRGTPRGLRRALEIYAEAEATVLEEFDARGVWRLDAAALDFDTRVASTSVDGLVVGSAAVGASGPEAAEAWGSALFADTAHRFSVVLPAADAASEEARRRVRATIEREKPAHASYHLCFPEPRLRVGLQSHVGLDAIVAGRAEGLRLDAGARLGLDSRTAEEPEGAPAAVGRHGRVGVDALLG